jgi:mono/diheme cytochrome c family protein
MRQSVWLIPALGAIALTSHAQALPDAPGKAAYQRACGTCHSADMVLGRAMNRDQWGAVVVDMISKGAKISDADFPVVVDYLAQSFPASTPAGRGGGPGRGGGGGLTMGPNDKHVVDPAAEARGRTVYIAECVTCHGAKARGSRDDAPEISRGPDLVRSLVVLHDRYGTALAPFLVKGHPMQSGKPSASLSKPQVGDLSHFLHAMVEETLRSGPYRQPVNILTGNANAGQAFFNGAGRCGSCHSPTGDLAHIAARYDPVALQQKLVFPRTASFGRGGRAAVAQPVTVTVTPPTGAAVTGTLVHLDDFNVSLRDPSGAYRSWKRTPNLNVVKKDPYAAHIELLNVYSDKNIHDVLAYLETMK